MKIAGLVVPDKTLTRHPPLYTLLTLLTFGVSSGHAVAARRAFPQPTSTRDPAVSDDGGVQTACARRCL